MSATTPRARRPYMVPQTIEYPTPPRTRTPKSVRAYIRYGRRRAILGTLRDLSNLAGLVVAGVSIPFLAWAGMWLGFLLFKA